MTSPSSAKNQQMAPVLTALCEQFQAAWDRGDRPRIEDWLEQTPPALQRDALKALLLIEIAVRRMQGDPPTFSELSARFPQRDNTIVDALRTAGRESGEEKTTNLFSPRNPEQPDLQIKETGSDTAIGSSRLRVRCPMCHEHCEISTCDSTREVSCGYCGAHFSLLPEETVSYAPDGDHMLAQFRLIRRLGSGGFGDVWLARDTVLNRQVALKIAKPHRFDHRNADQFYREARAAAQLRHPNIVSVHEVGREGEHLFIVSDFIHGATLGDHITSQRFTPQEAAQMCVQIARGLHHAHEAGIVHRDLKPQNIIVDIHGTPFITDFGLAKQEAPDVTVSIDGNIVGTPSYMSPEQARGDSQIVDRRSDVYSLGVLLYLLLTGELPFRGNFRMLVLQIANDAPPSPRKLESRIPRDLETICLKCLEKRPEHRYATAADVEADLSRWLKHEPIKAAPPGLVGRWIRWSQRKPALATMAVILIAVTLTGMTAFAWQYRETLAAHHELMMSQVEGLKTARPEEARVLLSNLSRFGTTVVPSLEHVRQDPTLSSAQRVRFALALLPHHPQEIDFLVAELPQRDIGEITLICESIRPRAAEVTDMLWRELNRDGIDTPALLRITTSLAQLDPDSSLWPQHARDVVAALTTLDPLELDEWLTALRPIGQILSPELKELFEYSSNPRHRVLAASALVEFLMDEPQSVVDLLRICDDRQLPVVISALNRGSSRVRKILEPVAAPSAAEQTRSANGIVNATIALAQLGSPQRMWALMDTNDQPDLRTLLIHRLAPSGFRHETLAAQLQIESSPRVRQAILQALGEYRPSQTTTRFRKAQQQRLYRIVESDPDAGVHSAAQWLLTRWELPPAIQDATVDSNSFVTAPDDQRNWYSNRLGQTFVVIRGPVSFSMGAVLTSGSPSDNKPPREQTIDHSFAIAMTELTLADYRRFADPERHDATVGSAPDCPVNNLSFNEVAAYCRWLSQQDGLAEEEMCFPDVAPQAKDPVEPYSDYLQRRGYRLPTEAEWEFACRAGTLGMRFCGSDSELMTHYAWLNDNSFGVSSPVAQLKPNPFGLFDVYGNLDELVMPVEKSQPKGRRILIRRGGNYLMPFTQVHSVVRGQIYQQTRSFTHGVRLARTVSVKP